MRLQRLQLFCKRDIQNDKKEQSNRFVRDEIIRVQTALQQDKFNAELIAQERLLLTKQENGCAAN